MSAERMKRANGFHDRGFNCCQSVLAAFTDVTGLSEEESFRIAAGFGRGAGTGELCGALSGAVMVLSLATPMDPADPVTGKKRAMAESRELQKRFSERFGHLRCQELLAEKYDPETVAPEAAAMGITGHCALMIASAVEITEELLAKRTESLKREITLHFSWHGHDGGEGL